MAQINIKLETELLKALFIGNNEEAMKKLLNNVTDAVLNSEAQEQIGVALYERREAGEVYKNGYRTRSLTKRLKAA